MTDAEKDCVRKENLAQKDWYNKEMKYYLFGIMPQMDTIQAFVLHKYYNISLQHMGCIMDRGMICYNNKVEQIIKRRYKVDLWKEVQQKIDSISALRK